MRHPQIVVYESDGTLARHLTETVGQHKWLLREARQTPACLNLVRRRGPTTLVVKVGRNVERELSLINAARRMAPAVPMAVVSDVDDGILEALLYDLGASFVLQPPLSSSRFVELVERMMQAAQQRTLGDAAGTESQRSPDA